MKTKLLAFFLALVLGYTPIVRASTPSPGPGWTQGISTTGQNVWFGPGTATKTSLGMGKAIWESAVPSRGAGGATFTATSKLAVGASEVAVVTKGAVTAAAVFAGVKTIVGATAGPVMLTLTALSVADIMVDYFTTSKTHLGPLSARESEKPFLLAQETMGVYWYANALYGDAEMGGFPNKEAACSAVYAKNAQVTSDMTQPYTIEGNQCLAWSKYFNESRNAGTISSRQGVGGLEWVPASMDDIKPYMDAPEKIITPEQIQEILKYVPLPIVYPAENGTYFPPGALSVVVNPTSVQGTPTTSTSETPTKITKTTTTPRTDVTTGSQNDPVTGKPVPTVTLQPGTKVVVTETDKATGLTTTVSTTTTETPASPETPKEDLGTISDTPFPPIPALYERKYPDGIKGVWDEKMAILKTTPLFTLVDILMPKNIATSGQCPSFMIPVNFGKWGEYGNLDFSPPCFVWDFGKVIIIISALLLSRRLIFGG